MSNAAENRRRAMEYVPERPEAPFSCEEYEERLARVRAGMEQAGVDLLYLTSQESLFYLTGYQAIWYQTLGLGSWEPISGVAVQRDGESYIHFECDREQALSRLTSISKDLRIWPLGQGDFLDFIVGHLKRQGWLKGTVGLECRHYRPYPAASARLRAAFKAEGCRVVDGTSVVNGVRHRKSKRERAYTRKAAEICDAGMQAAIKALRPGITELDLYAEATYAMAKAGGENPSITVPVQSGPRTVAAHAMPSRRVIEAGDIVGLDLCGVYHRYHADNARTFSLGEPDPEIAEIVKASGQAYAILSELLHPDIPLATVLPKIKAHYETRGLWGGQRWTGGYELGIAFPPDWVGPWSFTVGEDPGDARFEPGLVVNYESNFYLPGDPGMSLLIDTIIVDEDKAELVHKIPHDLIVIE